MCIRDRGSYLAYFWEFPRHGVSFGHVNRLWGSVPCALKATKRLQTHTDPFFIAKVILELFQVTLWPKFGCGSQWAKAAPCRKSGVSAIFNFQAGLNSQGIRSAVTLSSFRYFLSVTASRIQYYSAVTASSFPYCSSITVSLQFQVLLLYLRMVPQLQFLIPILQITSPVHDLHIPGQVCTGIPDYCSMICKIYVDHVCRLAFVWRGLFVHTNIGIVLST